MAEFLENFEYGDEIAKAKEGIRMENLQKLADDLEKLRVEMDLKKAEVVPSLVVDGLHEQYDALLTDEARKAMEYAIHSTIGFFYLNDGGTLTTYPVMLSVSVSEENIPTGAAFISDLLNKMASKGLIRGHLAKLSLLRVPAFPGMEAYLSLPAIPPSPATFCVFAMPHVEDKLVDEAVALYAPYAVKALDGNPGRPLDLLRCTAACGVDPDFKRCELWEGHEPRMHEVTMNTGKLYWWDKEDAC